MITERKWETMAIDGYISWYQEQGYNVVVSLNCRSGVTRDDIIRAAKIMWNRIDCTAYGKANVKRRGMRLKRVCMLDGGKMENKEMRSNSIVNKVQVRKNIDNSDTSGIDIKYIEEGKASTHNANLHYHCFVKSDGSFDTAQRLADEIKLIWDDIKIDERKIAGKHSKIEVYDSKRGNGWLWYCAKKAIDGMECSETSVNHRK